MSALVWIMVGIGWLIMTTITYVWLEAGGFRHHIREGKKPDDYKIEPQWWFLYLLWPGVGIFLGRDILEWMVRKAARIERLPEYKERRIRELEEKLKEET